MKSTIQILAITLSVLLLAALITFSSTPNAKSLTDDPYAYWEMLGKYAPNDSAK